MSHRVAIVGGGFGGLYTAKGLGRAPVDVTLVDRRNYHLFQPLLYQVATGGLSPGEIASPLRHVLDRNRNTSVWMAEVDFAQCALIGAPMRPLSAAASRAASNSVTMELTSLAFRP